MATLKTVTGKVTGPDGSPVPRAVITVTNSQPTTIPGSQEIAQPTASVIGGPDGSFSLSLYSNNDLTPNGTAYTVQAVGSIGQMPVTMTWTIQVPQTAGPFEISNIMTTTPTAQPTPNHVSTLTVDGAATFTAGPVVIGADPGGAQILRVGGAIALGVSALSAGSASIFSPAANQLSLAVNGAERLRVDATNLIVRSYGYNIGTDSGVFQGVGAVDGVLRAGTTDIVRLQTSGGTNLLSASLASGVTIPSGGLAVSTGDINVASGTGRLLQQGVPWISNGAPSRVVLGNVQWWGIDLLAGNLSTTSENIGVNIPAQTITVTAAIGTQRFALFGQPTLNATTAQTITNAATLAIAGPPLAAGSAVITNPYALWVQSGQSLFDSGTQGQPLNLRSSSINMAFQLVNTGASGASWQIINAGVGGTGGTGWFNIFDAGQGLNRLGISPTGLVTIFNGLAISASGLTVSAGGITVSAGGVKSVVGVRASTSPALTLTDSLTNGGDSVFYFSVPIGLGPDLNIFAGRVLFQSYAIQMNRIEALGTANTVILFSGGDVLVGQTGGYKFQVSALDFNPTTTKSKFGTTAAGAETAYTVAAFIGATGQTGDLTRWYNAAGTVLGSVSSAGLFALNNGLTVSAGVTTLQATTLASGALTVSAGGIIVQGALTTQTSPGINFNYAPTAAGTGAAPTLPANTPTGATGGALKYVPVQIQGVTAYLLAAQ